MSAEEQEKKEKKEKPRASRLAAYVDRLEDRLAVIVLTEDEEVLFELPVKHLPRGVRAGDHLTIDFKLDPAATAATRERVKELQEELKRGSDPEAKNFKL